MEDLKQCVKQYRDLDNELRDLNRQIYEKREQRKDVEHRMTEFFRMPQYSGFDKLKLDDDGTTIRIKRPDTWNKSWSLSMKELNEYVTEYFQMAPSPTPDGCVNYVIQKKKLTLVANEFSFERVVRDD